MRIKKLVIFCLSLTFFLGTTNLGLAASATSSFYTTTNVVSKEFREEIANQTKVRQFKNVEELKKFVSKKIGSVYGGGYNKFTAIGSEESISFRDSTGLVPQSDTLESGNVEGNQSGTEYSGTNIQIAGVDEADIVKTDGEYVYALVDNIIYIIKANPAENSEIVSKIELKGWPQDIYLNGDSLVVYGSDEAIVDNIIYQSFRRQSAFTFFKVYDIKDKKTPKLTRDLSYEGYYNDSRMIGDYVYLLTANPIYDYYNSAETVLPRIFSNGKVMKYCEGILRCPDMYYFDIPYESYNFVNVSAINIKDKNQVPSNDVYLLSGSENLFVSEKNMYITYTKYLDEAQLQMESMKEIIYPLLSQEYKARISLIEAVSELVLSDQEKLGKIMSVFYLYLNNLSVTEAKKINDEITNSLKRKYAEILDDIEKTVIHKISLNKEKIEYKTVTEVKGQVLNQFSMDEKDGYFRIATTKNQSWSQYVEEKDNKSYSNLYVLDESLKTVGVVEDLAKGERIYSARFMGDRAYMVTYRQVDPLFVLDLSNPKQPIVAGELKLPGYSSYLHPYDENTLIGLGRETKVEKNDRVVDIGLKLSLFDVSDISSPKEIDTYVFDNNSSFSNASYDHKAFLFSKDKNLLVIPLSENKISDEQKNSEFFNGAAVFKVDLTGFTLRGRLDHSEGVNMKNDDIWWNPYTYEYAIKRSLYIGDTLYTFSNGFMQSNKLENLDKIKKLELKKIEIRPLENYYGDVDGR